MDKYDPATACTAPGHEISRTWQETGDGRVECSCFCWTCGEIKEARKWRSWVEVWKLERVEE